MRWLLFGRSDRDIGFGDEYDYWWPLWFGEEHDAANADEMLKVTRERLDANGEENWIEIAVVKAESWKQAK